MKSTIIFEKISQVSLYLLVVLLPLWFLPITQNIVGYQKQALLLALVFVGVASWLAKMVYEGEVAFRTNWLHIPVVGLLLAFGASTLFSSWQYGSFWGWPLHVSDNFLAFLGFGLLYFLISQSVRDTKHLFFLLTGFLLSGTAAVIFSLLQMKGIFLLPFDFARAVNFNTLGTANSVALFAAILLPLALMLSSGKRKVWKGILLLVVVLLFGAIALVDFSSAWIATIVGLIALIAFDLRGHSAPGRISLPMIFVLIALFFIIVGDFSIPGAPVLQAEVSPSFQGELAILKDMVSESPFKALIGSGPGTFVFDYAKFHSPDLNQTMFWSTRFSSGKSELFDWLITKGTAGLLALLVVMGAAVVLAIKRVMQESDPSTELRVKDDGARFMTIGLAASFAAGTASLALHPANFALWFAFWVLAGSLGFLTAKRTRAWSLSSGPSFLALGSSLALLTVVVAGAGLLIIGGQKYYAEMEYMKGAHEAQEGNIEEAISKIAKAANLNPAVDLYWRDLAQMFLAKANQIASDQRLPADARAQQTGIAVNNTIEAVQRAVETNPANVANWNVQGFIYRSLIGAQGAEQFAIQSYEKSQALEPASPFPWTELARVKILQAQITKDQQLLQDALANLNKAVELKPDYAPAHYLIALVFDQQGKQAEAIAKLEETKLVAPNDVGLAFQLGVIYYRQNELEKARDEFERAKAMNAGYSNARYMLGLAYDRLGRKEEAFSEFEAVAEINPENQEVKDILANLAAGLPALTGIGQPGNPPIQENPPEIEENPSGEEE